MWECEFNREKKNNGELQSFRDSSKVMAVKTLNPRDAFFGGRTGNVKTYYDVRKNSSGKDIEKIRNVDVCSLYPWILKTGFFPVGHPVVYVNGDCENIAPNNNIENVQGLIKCRVLPPISLYHPVLPVRAHGKLFFSLCMSCCQNQIHSECPHENERDRELYGTWVACELRKAVEKGYVIQNVDEVWDYQVVQYNPKEKNTTGLFVEYINTFLKTKQEASGWPSQCTYERSKREYLSEYEEQEGVKLDPSKIEKNPGLRSLAKLFLNSFWGKFGQWENMKKKSIVNSYEEFCDLVFNPEIEISEFVLINQDTIFVNWTNNLDSFTPSDRVNVVIAAFTTAQARLKLYSYLEYLDRQVLYYDTDSVIYVSDGSRDLPTGDFLGDLTDELEGYGEGSYISSFVSGGPKVYAYIVQKPDGATAECCKLKGVRLNAETSELVNYNTVHFLVVDNVDSFNINYTSIRRDQYHQVLTQKETKIIRATGPKRRRLGESDSLPYGYKRSKPEIKK
ncbi:uncharacterized protein LOC130673909 [Microplitis mediator]|uniref:uncharacterized protein LOC130673909 n=1 Tax=Microplitis mediator TaxID=375433 RepID=UPI0025559C84|nr:uncharacterized protein LOC130673909 [Microplitis mediator]